MTTIPSATDAVAVLTEAHHTMAKSANLAEIRDLRDKAEAICRYIKSAAQGLERQNRAAEIKLHCERRAGKLLAKLRLRGGDRKSARRTQGVKLHDLGISRKQSAEWQLEASLSDEEFARFVQETTRDGKELTSRSLIRLARSRADSSISGDDDADSFGRIAAGLRNLARQRRQFACIYADPPWLRGEKSEITALPKRLRALPVEQIAAPEAHLHLWVPPESLEAGLAVLRAWGFRYRTLLVRRNAPLGFGDYWRPAHEMLLLGVRGSLPLQDNSLPSWLEGKDLIGQSGAGEIHTLIARVSPSPYLDLFRAKPLRGWSGPMSS